MPSTSTATTIPTAISGAVTRLRFFFDDPIHATAPAASPRRAVAGGSVDGVIASVMLVASAIAWVGSDVFGAAEVGPRVSANGLRGPCGPACGDGDAVFPRLFSGLIREVAFSESAL